MGVFDAIILKCPSCAADVRLQSKSGPGFCQETPGSIVPIEVAAGLVGDKSLCTGCGVLLNVRVFPETVLVSLEVIQ